jgi:carboxylesterase type B
LQNTGQYPYYNFSNIRFGTPPTGQARFTAASLPTGENKTVNDGQRSFICPQAAPGIFYPHFISV